MTDGQTILGFIVFIAGSRVVLSLICMFVKLLEHYSLILPAWIAPEANLALG